MKFKAEVDVSVLLYGQRINRATVGEALNAALSRIAASVTAVELKAELERRHWKPDGIQVVTDVTVT